MKQAENIVQIQGILNEAQVEEGTTKEGTPYVKALITVKVNLETAELEVPVRFFANKTTKTGAENPAYTNILALKNMTSLAACGGDVSLADCINIPKAQVAMNDYPNRAGTLVSYPTIRATFSNRVDKDKCIPTATFSNVFVVAGIKDETDANGDLTGRLVVKGILPQYGDKVDVVNYIVTKANAIKHIQTYWNKGDTVRVVGTVNFTYKVEKEIIEMGFGDPEVKMHTRSVSELIIEKGSAGALDEESSYSQEEIAKGLADRQARLAEMKHNIEVKANAVKPAPSVDYDNF